VTLFLCDIFFPAPNEGHILVRTRVTELFGIRSSRAGSITSALPSWRSPCPTRAGRESSPG
jgi:hypothetical protein